MALSMDLGRVKRILENKPILLGEIYHRSLKSSATLRLLQIKVCIFHLHQVTSRQGGFHGRVLSAQGRLLANGLVRIQLRV